MFTYIFDFCLLFIAIFCLASYFVVLFSLLFNAKSVEHLLFNTFLKVKMTGNIIGFKKSDEKLETVDKKTKEKVFLSLYYPIVEYYKDGIKFEKVSKNSFTISHISDFFDIKIEDEMEYIAVENPIFSKFSVYIENDNSDNDFVGYVCKYDEEFEKQNKEHIDRLYYSIPKEILRNRGFSEEYIDSLDWEKYKDLSSMGTIGAVMTEILMFLGIAILVFFYYLMYPLAEFIFPYISFLF